ncbi:hypothetical protein BLNAU_14542 [Blattamonas nauphoetae]|uniref:Uncharacterized protein n=1 Tax=Blattamonas nauphoetae TaxID=2049346 RepID=A0ABQ9XDH7_9EUKA|nr:hypothetical protein BLNAU_14542 [Blattamonas nauphoetae]
MNRNEGIIDPTTVPRDSKIQDVEQGSDKESQIFTAAEAKKSKEELYTAEAESRQAVQAVVFAIHDDDGGRPKGNISQLNREEYEWIRREKEVKIPEEDLESLKQGKERLRWESKEQLTEEDEEKQQEEEMKEVNEEMEARKDSEEVCSFQARKLISVFVQRRPLNDQHTKLITESKRSPNLFSTIGFLNTILRKQNHKISL